MKQNVLYLLCFIANSWARDPHSLQYCYTAITTGKITAVGLLDGQGFFSYDNNTIIRKTEWIQIKPDDAEYWNRARDYVQTQEDELHQVAKLIKSLTPTKEGFTLQRKCGCELHDDGTTRGYNQFGYDGEDFIILDLNTGTWTAATPQAVNVLKQWESAGDRGKHWKSYLKTECIEWLKLFVPPGRERKVRPEMSVFQKHSSSPEVVCHATGFFPKAVNITWQKDGEDVYKDVELRETLPNQDGSFQKRSILKVPAEELQKHTYTCVIQHSSLEKELVLSVSERRILRGEGSDGGSARALIGVIIPVVVTLVLIVVGIVIWKKKIPDFRPVPVICRRSSEVMSDILPGRSDTNDYNQGEKCEV